LAASVFTPIPLLRARLPPRFADHTLSDMGSQVKGRITGDEFRARIGQIRQEPLDWTALWEGRAPKACIAV
jgi:hypothetical protein